MKSYATAMLLVASSTAVKLNVNGEVTQSKLSARKINGGPPSSKLAQTKDWDNEMAGLMDVNGYMKPTQTSLADQDLHNTEKYSMSIDKFEQLQSKIKQKEEAEAQIRKEQIEMMEKEKKVQEETIKEAQQALKDNSMKGKTQDEKKQIIAEKIAEKATTLVEGTEKKEKTETKEKTDKKVEQKETKKTEQKEAKKTEDKKEKKVDQKKEAPKSLAQATKTETKKVEEKPKVAAPQVQEAPELTQEETKKASNEAFAQAAASLDLENQPKVNTQNLPQVVQKTEQKSKTGTIEGFFPGSTVDLNAAQREAKETHQNTMKDGQQNQLDAEKMAEDAQHNNYQMQQQQEDAKKQSLAQSESQMKVEQQLDEMRQNIESFCQTLDKEKIKEAVRIHQELKKQGVSDNKNKFEVNLVEKMQKGFVQFPEMAEYEYTQNQMSYLQAAQENFGANYTDDHLLDYMVNRAEEVGKNLKAQFTDFFRNPTGK